MGWFKDKNEETENESRPGGTDYETAAARVTAESVSPAPGSNEEAIENAEELIAAAEEQEDLVIKPAWAIEAVKGCFYPAAKLIHPAYALTDEQAEKAGPKMQVFLQAIADKYLPVAVGRLANKYPEFWDLAGALGVLYYQQWRAVSKIQAAEEKARREAGENAKRVAGVRVMPTRPAPIEGDPLADAANVI